MWNLGSRLDFNQDGYQLLEACRKGKHFLEVTLTIFCTFCRCLLGQVRHKGLKMLTILVWLLAKPLPRPIVLWSNRSGFARIADIMVWTLHSAIFPKSGSHILISTPRKTWDTKVSSSHDASRVFCFMMPQRPVGFSPWAKRWNPQRARNTAVQNGGVLNVKNGPGIQKSV